jgi:hypothetical protein
MEQMPGFAIAFILIVIVTGPHADGAGAALELGRRKLTNFATRHRLVILSLTLLPGHGVESGRFLLDVLAAAFGAFRVYFVFLQGEN